MAITQESQEIKNEVFRLSELGMKKPEIASKLGISSSWVKQIRAQRNPKIPSGTGVKWKKEHVDFMISGLENDIPLETIALELNRSVSGICNKCIELKLRKVFPKVREAIIRREKVRYSNLDNILRKKFLQTVYSSERRRLDVSITLDDLIEIFNKQNGKCFYTGKKFEQTIVSDDQPSIDRKDPTKGYTKDNVVISTWLINRMKTDMNYEKFINICQDIVCHINSPSP